MRYMRAPALAVLGGAEVYLDGFAVVLYVAALALVVDLLERREKKEKPGRKLPETR